VFEESLHLCDFPSRGPKIAYPFLVPKFPKKCPRAGQSVIPGGRSPKKNASMLVPLVFLPHLLLGGPAQVSLPSQTASPGSSIILPLVFDPKNNSVSGVQFDVQYDNTAMSLTAILGDAAKNAGKLLFEADLAPSRKRFLIVGLNPNPIADGTILNLFVNLNTSAPPGVFPLSFSNTAGTDPYGVFASVTNSDGAVTIQGTFDQAVPLQTAGVLNGASLVPGPMAPGEVFTLVGASIGAPGTRVLFDGIPASLLYAAPDQINGMAPYELVGHSMTDLQIINGARVITDLMISVAPQSPGIFTLDGSGVGQGAILNQDSSVNSPSNPAAKGTIVSIYATGSGQTDPPSSDGQTVGSLLAKPILPVLVQIGGVEAEVLYAGTSPGLITGALQVNCRIPATLDPGYSVPVILTVGTVSSPSGVTLAVQ
jgi:uncharacterized protein (TIGR03437 family)